MISSRSNTKAHKDEETNTASPWYLSVLQYLLMLSGAIQAVGKDIPEEYFPGNPANKKVLLGMSGWTAALKLASPFLLGLMWVNMFRSLWNLYKAENRNFERYPDAGLSVITTLGWSAMYVLAASAAAYLALNVVPYLIAALIAANAAYCLFNCCKNLYYAWNAKSSEERNEYLWRAGKQLLGSVTNVVGLVAGLMLGIQPGEALDAIAQSFENAKKMIAVFGALVLANIVAGTAKFNKHTFDILKDPGKAFNASINYITSQPTFLHAVGATLKTLGMGLLRLIASPFLLVQAPILYFQSGNTAVAVKPKIELQIQEPHAQTVEFKYSSQDREKDFKKLVGRIQQKIQVLDAENKASSSSVRIAKKMLLTNLLTDKLGVTENADQEISSSTIKIDKSIDELVTTAKTKERDVYRSFFRRTGEVQALVDETREFERVHCAAPAA